MTLPSRNLDKCKCIVIAFVVVFLSTCLPFFMLVFVVVSLVV